MSNQKRSKLPLGCLVAAGVVVTLFGGAVSISALTNIFSPKPEPTLDTNVIFTSAFETALAMNLETQAAVSPTLKPTITPFHTATDTLIPDIVATDTQAPLPTATSEVIPVTGVSCIPNNQPQTGRVVDIVDGDTIKVLLDQDGKTYTVRYIGMDTPENTSQIEYFGPEATAKNAELVYGTSVTLIKDVSETDPFGRLLRYVIVGDVFVNYELVAQGYANTASYPPDVACISTFQAVEQQASASKLGLWGAPPTPVPLPTVALAPPSSSNHPVGATAICMDGTYSYSQNRRGTCSHHGGVRTWLH